MDHNEALTILGKRGWQYVEPDFTRDGELRLMLAPPETDAPLLVVTLEQTRKLAYMVAEFPNEWWVCPNGHAYPQGDEERLLEHAFCGICAGELCPQCHNPVGELWGVVGDQCRACHRLGFRADSIPEYEWPERRQL